MVADAGASTKPNASCATAEMFSPLITPMLMRAASNTVFINRARRMRKLVEGFLIISDVTGVETTCRSSRLRGAVHLSNTWSRLLALPVG